MKKVLYLSLLAFTLGLFVPMAEAGATTTSQASVSGVKAKAHKKHKKHKKPHHKTAKKHAVQK